MPPPYFPPAPRSPFRRGLLPPPRGRGLLAAFRRGVAAPLDPLPRGAWAPLGDGRPRFGHCPPLSRRARPAPGAGHSSPCRHAFGVHGRAAGGARSSGGCRTRSPRPSSRPLPVGTRPATRACARLRQAKRPAWGAAANRPPSCRAGESAARFRAPKRGGLGPRACGSGRFSAASVGGLHLMPPLQALRLSPSLTRVVQIRLTADFQRRLSVRAFPSRFLGSFRRFGGYEGPPRLHFTPH